MRKLLFNLILFLSISLCSTAQVDFEAEEYSFLVIGRYQYDVSKDTMALSGILQDSGFVYFNKQSIRVKNCMTKTEQVFKVEKRKVNLSIGMNEFTTKLDGKEYIVGLNFNKKVLEIRYDTVTHVFLSFENDSNYIAEEVTMEIVNYDYYLYPETDSSPQFKRETNQEELKELLNQYIKEKAEELSFATKGKAFVSFVINEKGLVEEVEVKLGYDDSFDQFALRAISDFPKWKPGTVKKKPIKTKLTFKVELN